MNDNISNLTINLLELRKNFHARLAIKRELDVNKDEISRLCSRMEDSQIQKHLEEAIEFRKWYHFFK